jgi:hypothetical protein
MSNYFKYFRNVDYLFGNEQDTAVFQDITLMSTVIDQVADASTVYQEYYILPNERPDQVSQKLYGRPDYHWTFFLMNPKLQERGWPRSFGKLFEAAELKYPRKVITTRTKLTDKFKVGQTLTGQTSEATATILERNLDLGQLFLDDGVSGTFVAGENVNSTNSDGVIEVIVVQSFADQYNVAHHYENSSGDQVDIDPEVGPGAQLTEVTYLNRLERLNDADNEIKVIRPDSVNEIVRSFRETLSVR